jgi:hypothetical protein
MIKVFIPESKGKIKTSVRGFWHSQDTNKTYYDYLRIINLHHNIDTEPNLKALKLRYNQESIFHIFDNKGYIYYNKNKIEVLINRIYKEVLRANLKTEIKEALKIYGGVTIYKIDNKYFKEIFFK